MTKVLFLPEVVDQFLEIAEVLYNQGYFGYGEYAIEYSEQLFKDIQMHLPIKVKKDAPPYFDRYGKGLVYSLFPKNHHTTWYVFYSIYQIEGHTTYLVRYIGNNHIIADKL